MEAIQTIQLSLISENITQESNEFEDFFSGVYNSPHFTWLLLASYLTGQRLLYIWQ